MRDRLVTFLIALSTFCVGLSAGLLIYVFKAPIVREVSVLPVPAVISEPVEESPEELSPEDRMQEEKELRSLRRFREQMERQNASRRAGLSIPADEAAGNGLSAYQRRRRQPSTGIAGRAPPNREPRTELPGWERTEEQGVMLARIMANENTRVLRRRRGGGTEGAFTADTHAIAEVIVNNQFRLIGKRQKLGRRPNTWLEVMGELAPHVTKVVSPRKREDGRWKQHRWSSNLPADTCEQPEGFPGDWSLYAENWCTFRDAVVEAWVNDSFRNVSGTPIGWGNEEDLEKAKLRGLCVIPGLGDRNGFIATPGNGCQLEDLAMIAVAD